MDNNDEDFVILQAGSKNFLLEMMAHYLKNPTWSPDNGLKIQPWSPNDKLIIQTLTPWQATYWKTLPIGYQIWFKNVEKYSLFQNRERSFWRYEWGKNLEEGLMSPEERA